MMMFGGGLVIMLLFLLILIGVPLLIFVLVAGRGLASRPQSQPRSNPPDAPPASSAPLTGPSAETAYVGKCPTCGRGVKADWNVCPSCGAALA